MGMNRAGAPYGIQFNPIDVVANSRLALEASEFARDMGKFEEAHTRLFRAYFHEGENIGAKSTLLRLLGEIGLSVPIRFIAETFGAKVSYDEDSDTVIVEEGTDSTQSSSGTDSPTSGSTGDSGSNTGTGTSTTGPDTNTQTEPAQTGGTQTDTAQTGTAQPSQQQDNTIESQTVTNTPDSTTGSPNTFSI